MGTIQFTHMNGVASYRDFSREQVPALTAEVTSRPMFGRRAQTGPLADIENVRDLRELREELKNLRNQPDPFSPFEFLGQGLSKEVYKVKYSGNVLILTENLSRNEIARLEQLSRLGIIGKVFWEQSVLFDQRPDGSAGVAGIVMERAPGKTLSDALINCDLSPADQLEIAKNITQVIALLHVKAKLTHGDLKFDNLMVDGNSVALIDFGQSAPITRDDVTLEEEIGELWYNIVTPLLRGDPRTVLQQFQAFKAWYLEEARKHISVSSTTGGATESTTRRAIYDRAKRILDAFEHYLKSQP